jgi:hypothetical protein
MTGLEFGAPLLGELQIIGHADRQLEILHLAFSLAGLSDELFEGGGAIVAEVV